MLDKALRDGLAVLYLHASPDDVIERYLSPPKENPLWQSLPQNFSRLLVHSNAVKYSIDEAKMVEDILKRSLAAKEFGGVFGFVRDFANQSLTQRNNMPLVKYEEILRWRNTVHPLGTIPFISAYLADVDNKTLARGTRDFAINPILATDNKRIEVLLERGIADNHFHLKGSSPSFILSWISLMNKVTSRAGQFRKLKDGMLSDSLNITRRPLYALVVQAATIRLQLFDLLNDEVSPFSDEDFDSILRAVSEEEITSHTKKIQAIINSSVKASHIKDINDYAATGCFRSTFACISGEYAFQYKMFERIFSDDRKISYYADLFYAYLLIQIRLRSEMIQSNRQHGFANFDIYDRRKSLFYGSNKILKEHQIVMAASCLEQSYFNHVEARFAPSKDITIAQDVKYLDDILVKHYGNIEDRLHYVLHIPKTRENMEDVFNSPMPDNPYLLCRGCKLRYRVTSVISKLVELRDLHDPYVRRITGIDACSNEIGVRPEVFAADFRLAKRHQPARTALSMVEPEEMPMINVTYHVGEDFLDVADGLRAIWEAIEFLQMGRLDRLGHAIALGIDTQEWYDMRERRVFVTKQDLLDNLAWLLHYLGIHDVLPLQTHFALSKQCETLYNQIYRTNLPHQERENAFSLSDYIHAYELRGDWACAYLDYQENENLPDKFNHVLYCHPQALRDDVPDSPLYETRRTDLQAIRIYHHYHFNAKVRRSGCESTEFKLTQQHIDCVKQAQHLLQHEIAEKGIAIETNPSSNVLIGDFNRYDKHPIVSFYDRHIRDFPENPKLFVSINTDDQGVFDTCLENEYALMACGLEKLHDAQGKKAILSDDIYKWLEDIRRMGLEQRFR